MLKAMANKPNGTEIASSKTPILRLAISSLRTMSLRPIAFIDCKFSVSTGENINEKHNICMYGTQGNHLSVSNRTTKGVDTAAINDKAGINM